jgi:Na+-transporting NADH:ubiquinone oxidoreductase subunit NqrF
VGHKNQIKTKHKPERSLTFWYGFSSSRELVKEEAHGLRKERQLIWLLQKPALNLDLSESLR